MLPALPAFQVGALFQDLGLDLLYYFVELLRELTLGNVEALDVTLGLALGCAVLMAPEQLSDLLSDWYSFT
ncbi:MAG: hypothetical protein ACYSW8_33310 [Planctomycetota bacterium]